MSIGYKQTHTHTHTQVYSKKLSSTKITIEWHIQMTQALKGALRVSMQAWESSLLEWMDIYLKKADTLAQMDDDDDGAPYARS